MLLEAVISSGYNGKIHIEKSINSKSSIETSNSYEFFCKSFEKKSIKLQNPRIITIDGYVESVAELNRLFEESYETKYQLIIVARGFAEEVLSTIDLNKKRSSMYIHPVIIPFEIEGINTIVDISVISGLQPVSSNLGQLISNICMNDSQQLDEVIINSNSISIKNRKNRINVQIHVNNLIKKLEESKASEEIIEKRIKSLSSNRTIIRIPDDKDFIVKSQSIDFCLRSIKSLLDFGISKDGELFSTKKVSYIFAKKAIKQLSNLGAVIYC